MADVRLTAAVIAAGLLAGAGCRRAGAAPDEASGIAPPAGWQAMPAIAAAAKAALGPSGSAASAEAWGEPAMGCYGVWLALPAAGTAEAVGAQVAAGFTAAAGSGAGSSASAPLIVKDISAPPVPAQGSAAAPGAVTLSFERGEHRGRLRARVSGGRIAALACFANQREPLACEAACTALLGRLP